MRKLLTAIFAGLLIISASAVSTVLGVTKQELYQQHQTLQQQLDDVAKQLRDWVSPVVEPPPPPPPPPPPTSGSLANLVASMPHDSWAQLGTHTISQVAADCATAIGQNYCAVQGTKAILTTWGTAVFDGRYIIVGPAGGHNDYAGNEIFRQDTETGQWEQSTVASTFQAIGNGQVQITDGTQAPISNHPYDGAEWLSSIGRLFVVPQASYQSGTSYDSYAYLWNPADRATATKGWERKGKSSASSYDRGCAPWESNTPPLVICSYSNGLEEYNISTGTWRVRTNFDDQDFGKTAVIDPVTKQFIQVWKATKPLAYYDLTNTSASQVRKAMTVTGDTSFTLYGVPGLQILDDGRLVINAMGEEVWLGTRTGPTSFAFSKFIGANGPTYASNTAVGTYGKWRCISSLGACVLPRKWDEPTWVYKLPAPGATGSSASNTPTVLPSTLVANMKDGETLTLPKGTFGDCIQVKANNVKVLGYDTILTNRVCNGRGAVQTMGKNVAVEGITVRAPGGDGAASCFDIFSGTAYFKNIKGRDCNMNIRTGADRSISFIMEDFDFGPTVSAGQLQHGGYINKIGSAILRRGQIIGCNSSGHALKSRAANILIEDATIGHGTSACSRVLDFSEGGNNILRRVKLQQGVNTLNADMICQGCEVGVFTDIPAPGLPGDLRLENVTAISEWKGDRYGPYGNELIIARIGGKSESRVFYKNSTFTYVGGSPAARFQLTWNDQPMSRFIDEGGNSLTRQ